MAHEPDAPLSERERELAARLLRWDNLPTEFKAALTDYVSVNGALHVSFMPTLKGEEWRTPTLGSGWSNYTGAAGFQGGRFYKGASGIVRVEGLMTRNAAANGAAVFTLPEGYRPTATLIFDGIFQTGASAETTVRIDVEADGDIIVQSGSTPNYVSLSHISFRAA